LGGNVPINAQAGTTKVAAGIFSAVMPLSEKWIGASEMGARHAR
jgi:hypothetical protein